MRKFSLIFFFLFLFSSVNVQADIPKLIHYQGYLVDGQGVPLQGGYKVSFRIYDTQINGNLLWQKNFSAVEITAGNFAVLLDVGTANPALTFNMPYWLSIEVDDDGEMSPRQQIASSAYSINSQTVNGIPASATPTANTLLPLNAQGKFPQAVLDIQQGPGGNFNADTVDGFHASAATLPNTILPLNANAKLTQNVMPDDLNADMVDGKHAVDLVNRTNHTGVQPPATISPQGAGSTLDADTVDGYHASQIIRNELVTYNELKTAMASAIVEARCPDSVTVWMNDYSFAPNTSSSYGLNSISPCDESGSLPCLGVSDIYCFGGVEVSVSWRYVTASDPEPWIFVLADPSNGEIMAVWESEDHLPSQKQDFQIPIKIKNLHVQVYLIDNSVVPELKIKAQEDDQSLSAIVFKEYKIDPKPVEFKGRTLVEMKEGKRIEREIASLPADVNFRKLKIKGSIVTPSK